MTSREVSAPAKSIIVAAEAFAVPYWEVNDLGSQRSVLMVRLESSDGHVGWGEGVTLFNEATLAARSMADALLTRIIAFPALSPRAVSRELREACWWYGPDGIASFVISAVDMAAWDLLGNITDVSLTTLLGGPVHRSLPALVSCHAGHSDLETMTATMAGWVADSRAIGLKVGLGKTGNADLGRDAKRDLEFMARLRKQLGPGPAIMLDCGAKVRWKLDEAIRRIQAFQRYDLAWIEEPLGPQDPIGYAALRAQVATKLAFGEQEWTDAGIARLLTEGAVDVVGVDAGRVGGVSGAVDCMRMCTLHRRQANAHAWSGPLTMAAGLAVSLCSPSATLFEFQPLTNDLHHMAAPLIAPHDGQFYPMLGPGLGLVVNGDAVRHAAM